MSATSLVLFWQCLVLVFRSNWIRKFFNLLRISLIIRSKNRTRFFLNHFSQINRYLKKNIRIVRTPDFTRVLTLFYNSETPKREVQPEFCNPRLDTVNLSQNQLSDLPEEFGNLNLISLWLTENKFKEIPSCIYRFVFLWSWASSKSLRYLNEFYSNSFKILSWNY